MKSSLITKFAIGAIAAIGIAGFAQAKNLSPSEYQQIHAGMSQEEVQQILGKPAHVERYALSQTTTWSYDTSAFNERAGDRVLDVDFGSDGKVISVGPRTLNTD